MCTHVACNAKFYTVEISQEDFHALEALYQKIGLDFRGISKE